MHGADAGPVRLAHTDGGARRRPRSNAHHCMPIHQFMDLAPFAKRTQDRHIGTVRIRTVFEDGWHRAKLSRVSDEQEHRALDKGTAQTHERQRPGSRRPHLDPQRQHGTASFGNADGKPFDGTARILDLPADKTQPARMHRNPVTHRRIDANHTALAGDHQERQLGNTTRRQTCGHGLEMSAYRRGEP